MGKAKTLEQTQVAAIPYRIGHDGRVEVLLLTSGETRRWVIPKGWPMRGQKPRYVAEREALEAPADAACEFPSSSTMKSLPSGYLARMLSRRVDR